MHLSNVSKVIALLSWMEPLESSIMVPFKLCLHNPKSILSFQWLLRTVKWRSVRVVPNPSSIKTFYQMDSSVNCVY